MSDSSTPKRVATITITAAVVLSITLGGVSFGPAVAPIQEAAASHGGEHIDDFEDGDKVVGGANWNGWNGDNSTGDFDIESGVPINGSHSGYLQSSNQDVTITTTRSSSATPSRVGFRINVTDRTGSSSDAVQVRVRSGGSRLTQINFKADGTLQASDGAGASTTGAGWSASKDIDVEVRNVNYTSETYDLYIDGDQVATGNGFYSSVSAIDEISVRSYSAGSGGTLNAKIDDIELDGSNYPQPAPTNFSGGIIDDAEDGDLVVNADDFTGWTGECNDGSCDGDVSTGDELTVESTSPIAGSHSINLTTTGDDPLFKATASNSTYNPGRVTTQIRISRNTGNSNDGTKFQLQNSNDNRLIRMGFEANGTVNSDNGTIEVKNDDTGYDWTPGTTYNVTYHNFDWSTDTVDVSIDGTVVASNQSFANSGEVQGIGIRTHTDTSSSGSGDTVHVYYDDIEMVGGDLGTGGTGGGTATATVSGYVRDQTGQPVGNATVFTTQFDQSALTIDGRNLQDILDRPVPTEWENQLSNLESFSEDQFTPDFGTDQFSEKRVLMQTRGDWAAEDVSNDYLIRDRFIDKEPPSDIPARPAISDGSKTVFSCWTPDTRANADDIDSSIPGAETTSCSIEIQRIDPLGNPVWNDARTVETQEQLKVADTANSWDADDWTWRGPAKVHEFAAVELDPGVYKVQPEGQTDAALYYTVAPDSDPDKLEPDVENWDSACSGSTSMDWHNDVCDKIGSIDTLRTTTNESGYYELSIDTSLVDSVHLSAVKEGSVDTSDLEVTKENVRSNFESAVKQNFNEEAPTSWDPDGFTRSEFREYCSEMPSVANDIGMPYFGSTSTAVPNDNADIKGFRAPPPELPSSIQECAAMNIVDDLLNGDLGFLDSGFLDDFSDIDAGAREQLEDLLQFIEPNEALVEEVEKQTGVSIDGTDPTEYTDDEARKILEDGSDVLDESTGGNTGDDGGDSWVPGTGDSGPSVGDGEDTVDEVAETISMTWPVHGVDEWDDAAVLVRLDWSNGTTTTLSPESEYVTIDERLGRADQVRLEDYPVGDNDPAAVTPRIDIATPDGTDGSEIPGVRNPTFNGDIPGLQQVKLSTIQPGPNQNVTVSVAGDDGLGGLKRVEVKKPDGTTETVNASGGTAEWTAGGTGNHRLEVVVTNPGGVEFTEVLHVRAGEFTSSRPPTIKTSVGSVGRYAVASDGMDDARVEVSDGTSRIEVVGVLPEDATRAVVETTGAKIASDATHAIEFRQGSDERALDRSIDLVSRQPATTKDALYYRQGIPIPADGDGPEGGVERTSNATVWDTFTMGDGTLETRTVADPSIFQEVWHDIRLSLPFDPGRIGDSVGAVVAVTIDVTSTVADVVTTAAVPSAPMAPGGVSVVAA